MRESRRPPAVLPVLDILDGLVVRGIAGERHSYGPLQSSLAGSSLPMELACGIRNVVRHEWLYLADLNAIQFDQLQWDIIGELTAEGFRLIVDAGLRDVSRARNLCDAGVEIVVAASETLPGPQSLGDIVTTIGAHRTFFSLDLLRGRPLGNLENWETTNPISIGKQAIEVGVDGLIVLDLAGVGVGEGVPTEPICRQLRQAHPEVRLVTGGGVRHRNDVQNLLKTGVDSVLIASALHDGRIGAAEITGLEPTQRMLREQETDG